MAKIIGIGDAKMDKNCTDMIAYPGGQAMNVAVNAKLLPLETWLLAQRPSE